MVRAAVRPSADVRRTNPRQRRRRSLLAILLVLACLGGACAADPGVEPSASSVTPDAATSDDASESDPAPDREAEPAPTPSPTVAADDVESRDADDAAETLADEVEAPDPPPAFSPIDATFTVPPDWPSEPFPLEAEERVLANGMRVFVQANDSPGGQAQFRLVVAAGSVHEPPESLGAAHFLEHMMFNGTERWPGNELVPVLESFGAGFGPDVNAYTSFDETVYRLTVPSRDSANLDLAVDVLHQWATAALIDPAAVEAERGVVREEYRRSRETARGRIGDISREVLFGGTNREGRLPIGTLDSIDSMGAEELRSFYETWYRPENMTLIAVGEFDVDSMFRRIDTTFAEWTVDGVAPEQPPPGPAVGFAEPVFDVVTDPELTATDVVVSWRVPSVTVVDWPTRRDELVRRTALTLLDLRLFEATERSQASWLSAGAGLRTISPELVAVRVSARTSAADVNSDLAELLIAVEQLRQHPVAADELERALDRLRAAFSQADAISESRQDRDIADGLVDHALGGERPQAPDDMLAAALAGIDTIGPLDVQAFFDRMLRTPPYVLATAPGDDEADLLDPSELAETYDALIGMSVAAPKDDGEAVDRLMDPPDPVEVVERVAISELNATVVTFANGTRMAIRPTEIVRNQVDFVGWSRGGYFVESPDVAPLLGRAGSMVLRSGFESIDPVDLERLLGSRVVELDGDVGRAEEQLSGTASIDDVETLFQLIHLQMTEATINDVQLRRFDEFLRPIVEVPESIPVLVADLELWDLRYGDSPYFRLVPTIAELDALDRDAQLAAWNRRFANAGDFVFVFAGDVDVEQMIELGSRYLGTLPAASDRESAVDRDPGLPTENLVSTVAVGVGDQGRLRINWEAAYPFTIEAQVAAQVVEVVVDARLRDLVREELGASYAPSAAVSILSEPKSWVDTIIELNGDPDRLEEISQVIHAELDRLRAGQIDPQYLALAVDQLTEGWRFFSNANWIELVRFHMVHPERDPGEYRRRSDIARSMTPEDLAAATAAIFPADYSVEVRMVPAAD